MADVAGSLDTAAAEFLPFDYDKLAPSAAEPSDPARPRPRALWRSRD